MIECSSLRPTEILVTEKFIGACVSDAKENTCSPESFDILMELGNSIRALGEKADSNERWARRSTLALVISSAAIPIFIGMGGNWFFEKLVPSCLAGSLAVFSTWISFEKPHERWALYRKYQRAMQQEEIKYKSGLRPYDIPDKCLMLAEFLAKAQTDLHEEWADLLPSAEKVSSLGKASG